MHRYAANRLAAIYEPFKVPIYQTDIRSAEMIKYASNAFLATKISFINEIANICERVGANVDDVAEGMGLDRRIGKHFLKTGIGYGGSCFPKDTKALIQLAGNVQYNFELLKGVVQVNQKQQLLLIDKLIHKYGSLKNKKIAVLGLAFKPNTDDVREASSIFVTDKLIEYGAKVVAYDPVAINNAKKIFNRNVCYSNSVDDAIKGSDAVLILTDWDEFKMIAPEKFLTMNTPFVLDGRNCFQLEVMRKAGIEYYSVGRPLINKKEKIKL
ncbi:nucleotide sugar dehydrogenase [Aquibacillus albus]|uniref:UDP-glucose 6-dehydrogenase n=1 Tax=Aquibacillus albus TaxID=1168171 RepID=A0ABS2N5Q9_9BACI|nr:nucleotide sugar dehydrogenase [Aquibacillus albus]